MYISTCRSWRNISFYSISENSPWRCRKTFLASFIPILILGWSFTIGSLFRYKDQIPKSCCSGVVYKFCCSSCGESYIGSTNARLKTRVCQHLGISDRTGKMLTLPISSAVRDHLSQCDSPTSISNFDILDKAYANFDLRILESLHIFKLRPRLNGKGLCRSTK